MCRLLALGLFAATLCWADMSVNVNGSNDSVVCEEDDDGFSVQVSRDGKRADYSMQKEDENTMRVKFKNEAEDWDFKFVVENVDTTEDDPAVTLDDLCAALELWVEYNDKVLATMRNIADKKDVEASRAELKRLAYSISESAQPVVHISQRAEAQQVDFSADPRYDEKITYYRHINVRQNAARNQLLNLISEENFICSMMLIVDIKKEELKHADTRQKMQEYLKMERAAAELANAVLEGVTDATSAEEFLGGLTTLLREADFARRVVEKYALDDKEVGRELENGDEMMKNILGERVKALRQAECYGCKALEKALKVYTVIEE